MFSVSSLNQLCTKVLVFVLTASLVACTTVNVTEESDGAPAEPADVSKIPDAVPRHEPPSRYGNPESYEVYGYRYHVLPSSRGYFEQGIASWYGTKFHGRRTSSGETYDMYAMTAAHRTLPLPTYVEVINLDNGKKIIVKVNDRGPFHENRIIDLSYSAALKLDFARDGTALVEVRAINPGAPGQLPVIAESEQLSGKDGFFIQVGAFGNYTNAKQLMSRLSGLADDLMQINEVIISQQTYYRVRFGPIIDVNKADQIVAKLEEYGINEHRVVVDL